MIEIAQVEIREIRLELIAPFETSFGQTTRRRILLVRVFDRSGVEGWAECTAPENPFYNHEFVDGAWAVLSDFLIPMVLGKPIQRASDVAALMGRVRGNLMARGALEAACWDLEARMRGVPLWRLIGGERQEIACGVSIGIQKSGSILIEKVGQELAAGYRRIKLKIKPDLEQDIVRTVRGRWPKAPIMVDANSAYRLEDAVKLQALEQFDLMMIEQPLQYDDIVDHSRLQQQLKTPICLDESITSAAQARRALDLGSCRIINIKLGRVGGFREAKAIHDLCHSRNIPVWCGGMLESGIGRAHNVALSTLPGFTLPGDVSASRRYWERDIIQPPVEVSNRGTIEVPNQAGIGYTIDLDYVDAITSRKSQWPS